MHMHALKRFRRDERGVAVIEAAILMPVFITLVFGAVDASNFIVQSHRMEQGLSLAGAYLAKSQDPIAHAQRSRALAVTGTLDGSGSARVPGWSASDIRVTGRYVSGDYRSGDHAWVARYETTHTYEGFGMLKAITRGALEIKASHEERIEL